MIIDWQDQSVCYRCAEINARIVVGNKLACFVPRARACSYVEIITGKQWRTVTMVMAEEVNWRRYRDAWQKRRIQLQLFLCMLAGAASWLVLTLPPVTPPHKQ